MDSDVEKNAEKVFDGDITTCLSLLKNIPGPFFFNLNGNTTVHTLVLTVKSAGEI